MEIDAMRAMKMSAAVIGVALSGSGALAQSAVEWKVSKGGNGHWYAAVDAATGDEAMTLAASMGGHLVTISDVGENAFVEVLYRATGKQWAWIGLRQKNGQTSPGAGWYWVTGEPLSYTNWSDHNGEFPTGAPDDSPCALPPWGVENDQANQGVMDFTGRWDDLDTGPPTCGSPSWNNTAIIEWSADCNGDGIVDYGQILSGELADANANNIPDCCEQGTGCPANIVTNGSFEAGTPLNACSSESVAAGTSIGTGWQVTSGSVQRVRASSACAAQGTPKFGDFFVDLLDAGEIRQAIATTPGSSYRLTFWLSGDCAGGSATKRVTASLGTATQTFDHVCSGSGTQAWRSCSVEFIANAAITTLSLKSAAGGATNGPLVDGVRVEDISISCPGDVDGDGSVTGGDVSLVLLNFGDCPSN
jgi:hypothetical protein